MLENIAHPTLKAIVKYRKHWNLIAIAPVFTKECFSFNTIPIEDAVKEIRMLGSSNVIHATDTSEKLMNQLKN